MKFKSEKKSCGTCKAMFKNETSICPRNAHGACLRSGNYDKWIDIYELCNGCLHQETQVEHPEYCEDCCQIHLFGTKNNYHQGFF